VLQTERLSMRPVVPGDEALYCWLYGDPETMRFVGPPLSQERAQRGFRKLLEQGGRRPIELVLWVIVEKATNQSIGIGAFQDFDYPGRRVQAGMVLGGGARGKGFGKEGLRALIDYAFATFAVDEVWTQHAADNTGAGGLTVSLGLSHNTEIKSGKLVRSAWRHAWPVDSTSSG
jgi:RimJ/RimL family protein N-acetyltransferase